MTEEPMAEEAVKPAESAENAPLLSLYVPTYNRAALLDTALRAILGQITPAMRADVEVVVLDNASPDETPAVVARAQADFPYIALRSVRRPENIGCDANFTDSPNQTRGEFVYMLSDDDILLPGAVQKLLYLIGEHPGFDAFALNVSHFTNDPERQDTSVGFPLDADRVIRDRNEALRLFGSHISFLSSMAFRRANVLGKDYSPRRETNFGQAYLFLDALLPEQGLYVTSRRYLAMRQDNAEGYNVFRVLITNFHALMQHARRSGYSAEAVREVLDQHLLNVYRVVLILKSRGIGTLQPDYWDGTVRLLRSYGVSGFVLLKFVPRMLVPYGAIRLVQRLLNHENPRDEREPFGGSA